VRTAVCSHAFAVTLTADKPCSPVQVYRKIHACALELLAKLGHSYVISTLSREPLFSISEDREVVCKEGALCCLPRACPQSRCTDTYGQRRYVCCHLGCDGCLRRSMSGCIAESSQVLSGLPIVREFDALMC
jgi:hypothetical protein